MFGSKKNKGSAASSQSGEDDFWGTESASAETAPPPELDQAATLAYTPTDASPPKSLLEFLEPLFQKVCGFHRVQAMGADLKFNDVRPQIEAVLAKLEKDANANQALRTHFEFLQQPIKWFLDSMFGTADSSFPRDFWETWSKSYLSEATKSADGGTLTGGDLFFDDPRRGLDFMLDEKQTNRDDPVANERLQFYYTCIGLGLQGRYYDAPEKLKNYMERIYPRISNLIDQDPEGMLTPHAYDHLNTDDFVVFTQKKPLLLLSVFVIFLAANICAYVWTYDQKIETLEDAIKIIVADPKATT